MNGIVRRDIKMLLSFLEPFKEETKKLEGEDYPTLPLAVLAKSKLRKHCMQRLQRVNL